MINNFEILKPLLYFNDDFYVRVMLLSRAKDNGIQKNLETMFFGSLVELENKFNELISRANNCRCRIYVDLIARRLSTGFLSQIEWERNKVYGLKPQCNNVGIPIFYSLYDADSYTTELNKLIENTANSLNISFIKIKSSDKGEHWLFLEPELLKIKSIVENKRADIKIHTNFAWACLYNPF